MVDITPAESRRLSDVSPQLHRLLMRGDLPPARFGVSDIKCETVKVSMRDGIQLATDIYLPPHRPAPVVAVRTPYGRGREDRNFSAALFAFARRGYAVVSQDCRGTGDSEPDSWDFYMYESEDGYDLVEWISRQEWASGFIGSFGSSYAGQTQWCMATHPRMSTIVPGVSGLGLGVNTTHLHMFVNAYARSVGKGDEKVSVPYWELEQLMLDETLAGGFFNEQLHFPLSPASAKQYPELEKMSAPKARKWLWEKYCSLRSAERAAFVQQALGKKDITLADLVSLPSIFGQEISDDRHTIPVADEVQLCRMIQAPPLMRTGWYDWALNDALATWEALRRHGEESVAGRARMIITPTAHSMPGYREGAEHYPELLRSTNMLEALALLTEWYTAVREGNTAAWPVVIYYLMGANEWHTASDWPVPGAKSTRLFLAENEALSSTQPVCASSPDIYVYDPNDPTPTLGGNIVSYVYQPGSCDVSSLHRRPDVLVYRSPVLEHDMDVVGPLRMVLYASSSAVDTDFAVRLCDIFPDGRAIQIQTGILRVRYRDIAEPRLIEPGRIYRYEIDLWATANRFKAGHRFGLDISSADFPRFDRNANRGGELGEPMRAIQTIYHDVEHPSHLLMSVLD